MAFKKTEKIEKLGNVRRFNAIEGLYTEDYWEFKYDADNPEAAGTIFFDGGTATLYMESTIENVVIDNTPPEFIGENIQYMIFNTDRVCKFTINSDTLLDICQLEIKCGDEQLAEYKRKDNIQSVSEYITNISVSKQNNTYVLSFTLGKEYGIDKLNTDQLTVKVWDIASNSAEYTTVKTWYNLKGNPDALKHLIIEFVNVEPDNFVISKNVEGKVLAKVSNPNEDLWEIQPSVNLFDNSIGHIDESTLDYNPNTGVLLFYVTQINARGTLNVETWIDIDNDDIRAIIKNQTYADVSLGPFFYMDEGRKYKFMSYVPKYLDDEEYNRFVKHVETFLNTSQESLKTGNCISTLEKIARINNFMDPFLTEPPLLSEYSKQFNIEVNPTLDKFIYYLKHRKEH